MGPPTTLYPADFYFLALIHQWWPKINSLAFQLGWPSPPPGFPVYYSQAWDFIKNNWNYEMEKTIIPIATMSEVTEAIRSFPKIIVDSFYLFKTLLLCLTDSDMTRCFHLTGMNCYTRALANYASPSSGEAYRGRQLTTKFELWVEIFCVPTCFHVRIPKPCPSVRTPRKDIIIASSISVLH